MGAKAYSDIGRDWQEWNNPNPDDGGYSYSYWKHVAMSYARRNGATMQEAKGFAEWCITGWMDDEHVDHAFERWVMFGSPMPEWSGYCS